MECESCLNFKSVNEDYEKTKSCVIDGVIFGWIPCNATTAPGWCPKKKGGN